jgi:hypothetical protein
LGQVGAAATGPDAYRQQHRLGQVILDVQVRRRLGRPRSAQLAGTPHRQPQRDQHLLGRSVGLQGVPRHQNSATDLVVDGVQRVAEHVPGRRNNPGARPLRQPRRHHVGQGVVAQHGFGARQLGQRCCRQLGVGVPGPDRA